jgi:hypothetical protein
LLAAHDGPWSRVLASSCPCTRSDTVVARSPHTTACHLPLPATCASLHSYPLAAWLHQDEKAFCFLFVPSLLTPLRALLLGAERHHRLEPLCRTSSRRDSPSCDRDLQQVSPVIEPPSSVRRRRCTESPPHPLRASPLSAAAGHETDALPAP